MRFCFNYCFCWEVLKNGVDHKWFKIPNGSTNGIRSKTFLWALVATPHGIRRVTKQRAVATQKRRENHITWSQYRFWTRYALGLFQRFLVYKSYITLGITFDLQNFHLPSVFDAAFHLQKGTKKVWSYTPEVYFPRVETPEKMVGPGRRDDPPFLLGPFGVTFQGEKSLLNFGRVEGDFKRQTWRVEGGLRSWYQTSCQWSLYFFLKQTKQS